MSIPCPCGGGSAFSRDEMIAFDLEHVDPADTEGRRRVERSWAQCLGPNDFYCPHEDDVLLKSEVYQARRGWGIFP